MRKNIMRYLLATILILFSFSAVACKEKNTNIETAVIQISSESYSYTGSAITPEVTVLLGQTTLTLNSDFTISYSNNTEIGKATITISGINNYTGTASKDFTIIPATITGISAENISTTYDGSEKSIVVAGLIDGDIVSYKKQASDSYSSSLPTFIDVGTYTIYYKVNRDHHLPYESSATVTITPKVITGITAENVTCDYDGNEKSITVNGLTSGDTLSYSLTQDGTYTSTLSVANAGIHTIYYKVTRKNHSDYIGSATITINAIEQTNIEYYNQNFGYDGEIKYANIVVPEGSTIYYKLKYNESYSTTYPDIVNVGSYSLYFKVVTPNYIDYENVLLIEIGTSYQNDIFAENIDVLYDGQPHSIVIENVLPNSTVTYKLRSTDSYKLTENPEFTNAGTYTVYYRVTLKNYVDFYSSATVTIRPLTMTGVSCENITTDYNGSDIKINVTGVPNGSLVLYKTDNDATFSSVNPTFTDVGVYTVYYKVTKPNYSTIESSATITINALNQTQITADDIVVDYDGNAKRINVVGYDAGRVFYSTTGNEEDYTLLNPSFTTVGSYTVYYKVVRKNYNDYYSSATITINKATQNIVAKNTNYDYDGKIHTITLENTGNGTAYYSINGVDYRVQPYYYTDAGSYTIYYKVIRENYNDFISNTKLTINKITQNGIICRNVTETYNGSSHTITVSNTNGAVIYYSINNTDNYTTTKPRLVDAGIYTIYYKAVKKNYLDFTGQATLTINGLEQSGISAEDIKCTYDEVARSISVTGTAEGSTILYSTTGGQSYSPENPTFTEVGEHIVTYKVSRKNYRDFISSAKITIEAKRMAVTSYDTSVIYDGNAHTITVNNTPDRSTVYYKNQYGSYVVDAPSYTEVGKYLVEYKVVCDNYTDFYGSSYISIATYYSSVELTPIASSIVYGQSLTYSHLEGGVGNVEGTFKWLDETIVPTVDDSNKTLYTAVFVPTNITYAQTTFEVTVPVEKADPTITFDFSGQTIYIDMPFPNKIPYTSNAEGEFTVTSEKVLERNKEYSYTFTPTSNNYNVYSGTFIIPISEAEPSKINILSSEQSSFYFDDVISKSNFAIKLTYSDNSTRILDESEFEIVYQTANNCVSVGDSHVTISYKGKTCIFDILTNKATPIISLSYNGKTSYYKGFNITLDDFEISNQSADGYVELFTNSYYISFGRNIINYRFVPQNTDKYNEVTGSVVINITYSPLITNVVVDEIEKTLTLKKQTINIANEQNKATFDLTLSFDETNFIACTSKGDIQNSKLTSGKNTLSLVDGKTTVYIYEADFTADTIQEINVMQFNDSLIESISYTENFIREETSAEYEVNDGVFTAVINSQAIVDSINVVVAEDHTYNICYNNGDEFKLENLDLGTYNLVINVYNNERELVESKALRFEYYPNMEMEQLQIIVDNETYYEFEYDNKLNSFIKTIIFNEQTESVKLRATINETMSIELFEEIGNLAGEMTTRNFDLDITTLLSGGKNTFNGVIYYNGSSIKVNIVIDCLEQDISEFVSSVVTRIDGTTYTFDTTDYVNNYNTPIPVIYSLEEIRDGLTITYANTSYRHEAEVVDDTIFVNIYDNLTAIASFRLYIHYDGIKNDDTTINYSVQKVSNKNIENELAQTTQTLKLNIGDTFTFETNNNYASVSTEYDCLYDNGIYYFNELGTYTLTITVTASDKVTTNTYTFIFKIVENEDIVTITLSNGKTISLKDSFTNLNFGSFAYTESNISGDTTTYELIKLYDLDYYNEIVSQNKTSLSFNLKKSGLTIYANTSNNIITSYNDVEFNLTQVGETYELIFGVKFAANIDKEIKNVVLNCKIIFKDVTRLATITTTNNSLTTNYVLGLSNNNELAGDFNATIIDDEFCYATSLTENSYTTTDEGSKLTVNITHNSIYTIVKNDTLNTKLDTTGNISLDIIEINEEKVAMFKVVSTSQYEEYLQGEISVLEGFLVVLKLK